MDKYQFLHFNVLLSDGIISAQIPCLFYHIGKTSGDWQAAAVSSSFSVSIRTSCEKKQKKKPFASAVADSKIMLDLIIYLFTHLPGKHSIHSSAAQVSDAVSQLFHYAGVRSAVTTP